MERIKEREEVLKFFEEKIKTLSEEERRPYIIIKEICEKQIIELLSRPIVQPDSTQVS